MDSRIPARPDSASRYGFENAPVSKLLLLASGAATLNFLFLPNKYQLLVDLHWPSVFSRNEIWRLLTSQIVFDSTVELLYGSALIYNFRRLERQWGSKKFSSAILATCSLTFGAHLLCCSSELIKPYIQVDQTMVGGLYGPLFALLVFYINDIYSGSLLLHNGFSLSSKWLVSLIAARMLFTNSKSTIAGLIGMLSGLLYRWNVLYIKDWLVIPAPVSKLVCSVYNWFCIEDDSKRKHRKSYAGATEDIHEDIVYDYMLKMQSTGQGSQIGQGHADTLQPAMFPIDGFFNPPRHDNHSPSSAQFVNDSNAENIVNSHESLPGDKIELLVDMGFTREAVVKALQDTGNNTQEATNLLLSR